MIDSATAYSAAMKTDRVIAALAALAQETRLAVFRLLVECGPEGMAAGAIGEAVGVPAATLSFHLQQLNHAGLVKKRRMSRSLIYAADMTCMNELVAFLTQSCCGGQPELCAVPTIRVPAVPARPKRQTAARKRG